MASIRPMRRLLASSTTKLCSRCLLHACRDSRRTFSYSHNASESTPTKSDIPEPSESSVDSPIAKTTQYARPYRPQASNSSFPSINSALDGTPGDSFLSRQFSQDLQAAEEIKPHRLYIYAHKHNTHITLSQPTRSGTGTLDSLPLGTNAGATEQKKTVNTLISLSTGNLGFKKSQRSTYDAAYQLAAFVLRQIQEKGILRDINKLEVSLRGFGKGREAVTKALLGSEGRNIRGKITAVMDATRLKVGGGSRAPKPRRL